MYLPRFAFAVLLSTLAGCAIYAYSDDEPPPQCDVAVLPAPRLRNPVTGQCQYQRTPDPCAGEMLPLPLPPWGTCDSRCEALGEYACVADPSCHAVYVESCPSGSTCIASYPQYAGCWAVAPAPGTGACDALDAQGCAGRADCAGIFVNPAGQPDPSLRWQFTACVGEDDGACRGEEDCGLGEHCNLTDYCLPPRGCGPADLCPPVCYGKCEPDPVSCDLVDCRVGDHCEVVCTPPPPKACVDAKGRPIPCPAECHATCVPDRKPGACRGEVLCDAAPPPCPVNTVPGIANGCYTGYCIPVRDCPP